MVAWHTDDLSPKSPPLKGDYAGLDSHGRLSHLSHLFLVLVLVIGVASQLKAARADVVAPYEARAEPSTQLVRIRDLAEEQNFERASTDMLCGRPEGHLILKNSLANVAGRQIEGLSRLRRPLIVKTAVYSGAALHANEAHGELDFLRLGVPGVYKEVVDGEGKRLSESWHLQAAQDNSRPVRNEHLMSGDVGLLLADRSLLAHNASLAVDRKERTSTDQRLDTSDDNKPDIRTGYPILDNPGRTLALILPLIALVGVGTKKAEELIAGDRWYVAAGVLAALFIALMIYAPLVIDGRFIWQPWGGR
jgi:hypothetical protein